MKWVISWPRGWREKGCENRRAFRLPRAEPRASLRSALPGAQAFTCQWGAHGARPAKRLRTQPSAKRLPCHLLLARGASGPPLAKRETASGKATGKPMLRTCQVLRSFAVRAPCAHHRKANTPPMARCFAKKRAATGKGNERKARIAKPFTTGKPMPRTWPGASQKSAFPAAGPPARILTYIP